MHKYVILLVHIDFNRRYAGDSSPSSALEALAKGAALTQPVSLALRMNR
jgi:hypothetical protein